MASPPRCFFAAMPSADVQAVIQSRLQSAGVLDALGERLFAPDNWHQTFSGRHYRAGAETIDRLLQAGERVQASAFTLTFNRIDWRHDATKNRNLCTLRAKGTGNELKPILGDVQTALGSVGLADGEGHTPHITLSYKAAGLHPTVAILPLDWTIDELLLVEGGGDPYYYQVLGRWPLPPLTTPQGQADLFATLG